jgi:hypothetical protein
MLKQTRWVGFLSASNSALLYVGVSSYQELTQKGFPDHLRLPAKEKREVAGIGKQTTRMRVDRIPRDEIL